MKDICDKKNIQIKVRITPIEKEKIDNYCEEHECTISDFLRVAANKLLREEN
jgi:hypothetical protein